MLVVEVPVSRAHAAMEDMTGIALLKSFDSARLAVGAPLSTVEGEDGGRSGVVVTGIGCGVRQ